MKPRRIFFSKTRKGKALLTGMIEDNPVCCQYLGICSALAVTGRLENTIVMCFALLFVTVFSSLSISILRKIIPGRVRMITMVMVISTAVILIDMILKSFAWEISKQLGPYVGLIITNCIIMGRAEAFAMSNSPFYSLLDAIGNSMGYMYVLLGVAFFRELFGAGTLFNIRVLPEDYVVNQVMILAPGAFIMLGIISGLIMYKNMRRS